MAPLHALAILSLVWAFSVDASAPRSHGDRDVVLCFRTNVFYYWCSNVYKSAVCKPLVPLCLFAADPLCQRGDTCALYNMQPQCSKPSPPVCPAKDCHAAATQFKVSASFFWLADCQVGAWQVHSNLVG
jgi:hypothetical protein